MTGLPRVSAGVWKGMHARVCVCVCVCVGPNWAKTALCLEGLQESACNAGDLGLIPGLERSPEEGKGSDQISRSVVSDSLQPHESQHARPWPGEFHGPHSPWGRKESDRTEQLSLSLTKQVLPGLGEGESGDAPCPVTWSQLPSLWPQFPHLYLKGGTLLPAGPYQLRASQVHSLALLPTPTPPPSFHSWKGGRVLGAAEDEHSWSPCPSETMRGRDIPPPGELGGRDPPRPTRIRLSRAVPGSRPTPACPSSPCGSARTTTGSPASRRGSRCRGRSRPSPRPRPSVLSCHGVSL